MPNKGTVFFLPYVYSSYMHLLCPAGFTYIANLFCIKRIGAKLLGKELYNEHK